jgi:hypothetical protein
LQLGEQAGAIPAEGGAGEQVDVDRRFTRRDPGGNQPGPGRGERLMERNVQTSPSDAIFSFSAL